MKIDVTTSTIEAVYRNNRFRNWRFDIEDLVRDTRMIVVIRNYDHRSGLYIDDTGDNNCDSIILMDGDGLIPLTGRSIPHRKYQSEQIAGTGAANRIATGYYHKAFRKGLHRGLPALRQNRSFVIWRSSDHEWGNEDDWSYSDIVADNFHGYAPFSAGCITVEGRMSPDPTGDWWVAHRWIYKTHETDTYYSCMILNASDFVNSWMPTKERLRVGSEGEDVKDLQICLGLKADGDFGPMTHDTLVRFQKKQKLEDDGIYGPETHREIVALYGDDAPEMFMPEDDEAA